MGAFTALPVDRRRSEPSPITRTNHITLVHGPGIETLPPLPPPPSPPGIFGDNDFWIAHYVSFQYLLVCKMNYSAFRDYLRWYIAA